MNKVSAGQELKVFISYSRRDSGDFADELVAGLKLAGFAPFLDRHDIAAGEDWEARLGGLIQEADTVVFVVSPEAVRSERCAWEIEKTLTLSKRLLPVIFKPVPESGIPQQLRRLQFARFDTGPSFARPLAQLAEWLRQDLDWIREHTRLSELAARWQTRSRTSSLLLRGEDLDAAKAWATNRKPDAPEITDLLRAFLTTSGEAEAARIAESEATRIQTRRMRLFAGVLFIGTVTGLAYAAWSNQTFFKVRIVTLSDLFSPKMLSSNIEGALKPGQSFQECAICPEMVVVPAGEFMMGSAPNAGGAEEDETPQHKVAISKAFAVSRFEVTFDEWDACVTLGGCAWKPGDEGFGRGRRPVINVSWEDVHQYLRWLTERTGKDYQLLSEAEWEYSARGGTATSYPWGDEIGQGNANCGGCGSRWDSKQTAPVGSFAANGYGLFDMQGNVFEWVQDCYQKNYKGAPTDGLAWETPCAEGHRVFRGGGWRELPKDLRAAHRDYDYIGTRGGGLGFRVKRTISARIRPTP